MTSLIHFVSANRHDFWLNVLAGIPFLLVDLIIITLLLPWVIEWWNDKRWEETRRMAILRVMLDYVKVAGLGGRLYGLAQRDFGDLFPNDEPDRFSASLFDFSDAARALAARADLSIQTIMPVLGPKEVRDMLHFHMAYNHVIGLLDSLIERLERTARSNESAIRLLEDIDELSLMAAEVQTAKYKLLEKYGDGSEQDAETDGCQGALWEDRYPDQSSQALEHLASLVRPQIDMSEKARLQRARDRRLAINLRRQDKGLKPVKAPVRLYSFEGTGTLA